LSLTDDDLALVLSATPMVGIEAAAGAGKTHEACELALRWSAGLLPHQSVLFLSHTNAARDVFRRRIGTNQGLRAQVGITTLDSFCLDILNPYARLWELPVPLHTPRPLPEGWFADVRAKAARLLRARAPIAKAIAARYPFVIADEHQDASRDHHAILCQLAEAGARVRMFGDALQAILTFDATIPGWETLMHGIPVVTMSGSWRWADTPELGAWVAAARQCLLEHRPIALDAAPACVRVVRTERDRGVTWPRCTTVRNVLEGYTDGRSVVVLGRRNDDVKEIARVAELELVVNEGSDLGTVEEVIEEVLACQGDAASAARVFVDFMIDVGVLPDATADAIRTLNFTTGVPGLTEVVEQLRASPNLRGLVAATRAAKRSAEQLGWEVIHPIALQTIATLPLHVGADDVQTLAYQAQRAMSELPMPPRCASTIHKAKGREFASVVLPSLDATTFRDSLWDRQLLYVALSRARNELTLVVPVGSPSPLITL